MTKENKLKKIADFILKYWPLVGIFIAILGFGYNLIFGTINNINNQLFEIKDIATNNQQMTLKNTIWNEEIPIEDRALACDKYLSLGYNSYTKKKCEKILEKEIEEEEKENEK